MEISELRRLDALKRLQKKVEAKATAPVGDKMEVAPPKGKMKVWVEMLKEMPDVRPEKVNASLKTSSSSALDSFLARRLMEEGF